MNDVKKHPLWLECVDWVVDVVKEKGRGVFISHEELREMLGIKTPKTIEEHTKAQFEYLNALDSLRYELLNEHNIFLDNKKGEGYIVLQPDDQITKGSEKYINKARDLVLRAGQVLICVEQQLLSAEVEKVRLNRMKKVAFLRAGFKKRKFPEIEETKQIGAK